MKNFSHVPEEDFSVCQGSRVVCLDKRIVLHQWILCVCVCLCVFVGTSSAAEESDAGRCVGVLRLGSPQERDCLETTARESVTEPASLCARVPAC